MYLHKIAGDISCEFLLASQQNVIHHRLDILSADLWQTILEDRICRKMDMGPLLTLDC